MRTVVSAAEVHTCQCVGTKRQQRAIGHHEAFKKYNFFHDIHVRMRANQRREPVGGVLLIRLHCAFRFIRLL